VQPNFALTPVNALALAAIVVRLDGLPLAIELAAAQLKTLSPEELAARLVNRLATLTRGPRNRSARQQTLRGAIAWSFDRLDEETQVCSRAWASSAAGSPAKPPVSVGESERLIDLIDANLVHRANQVLDPPRFTLLEMLREFASEQLRRGVRKRSGGRDTRRFIARWPRWLSLTCMLPTSAPGSIGSITITKICAPR